MSDQAVQARAWLEVADEAQSLTLRACGDWIVAHAAAIESGLRSLDMYGREAVTFDLSGLARLDTAGAWLIHRTRRSFERAGAKVTIAGAIHTYETLLAAVARGDKQLAAEDPPDGPLLQIVIRMGRALHEAGKTTRAIVAFLGLVLETLLRTLANPRRLRVTSTAYHMEQAGLNAVPIVCMITFLIGAVMAYQGAEQLKRFGAEVFAVNLLAAGFLREIGILLTAIMVAGRSGSAFTAQIGSMKLREEIDAMRTMGLDPVEVLVLPRVIALVLMVPVLGFIASMMGLLGGGLVLWLELGMSPAMYVERLHAAAEFWDGAVAFVKAPFFGLMIALIGCFEGLKVSGSAESVGQRTTASVVEGIFTVIVVDAVFSILFLKLGI
jgi:phospholipid/cholesterol/gamma-HCH transport system permease protein